MPGLKPKSFARTGLRTAGPKPGTGRMPSHAMSDGPRVQGVGESGITYGSAGRTPGNPETSRLGRRVGKTRGDHLPSRHIKVQIKGSDKGHKRDLVRPVHQGASRSQKFMTPKARGPVGFSFGTM